MTDHSRRNFFKSLVKKRPSEEGGQVTVFKLGHISVFPVGSETPIHVMNHALVVKSLPEGFQLVDQNINQNYRLAIGSDGQLIGDLGTRWPLNSVLSIFSGEISNIEGVVI